MVAARRSRVGLDRYQQREPTESGARGTAGVTGGVTAGGTTGGTAPPPPPPRPRPPPPRPPTPRPPPLAGGCLWGGGFGAGGLAAGGLRTGGVGARAAMDGAREDLRGGCAIGTRLRAYTSATECEAIRLWNSWMVRSEEWDAAPVPSAKCSEPRPAKHARPSAARSMAHDSVLPLGWRPTNTPTKWKGAGRAALLLALMVLSKKSGGLSGETSSPCARGNSSGDVAKLSPVGAGL